MIKNIVFDMGNVLVDYMVDRVYRYFIKDPEARKKVSTFVLVSPEQILLDMGVILEDTVLKKMQARLDTEKEHSLATLCFNRWYEFNMYKKEGVEDVIRQFKSMGYDIHLCSNASVRLLGCYKDMLPAVDYFDGILFSADALCLESQREIYGYLSEWFHLKPEECFFVDDLELNIKSARRCGMDRCCFDDGNVEKLREVLAGLNRR